MIHKKAVSVLMLGVVLVATSFVAQAQPASKIPRIGWLGTPGRADSADIVEGFRGELRQLGYTEGKNILIEYRFADGRAERLPDLALELVNLNVDAIAANGSQAAIAARRATATTPSSW